MTMMSTMIVLVMTTVFALNAFATEGVRVYVDRPFIQDYSENVHAGALKPNRQYRPLTDMHICDLDVWRGGFIYLTDTQILSNAWAGRLITEHRSPHARLLTPTEDSDFLLVADQRLVYLRGNEPVRD